MKCLFVAINPMTSLHVYLLTTATDKPILRRFHLSWLFGSKKFKAAYGGRENWSFWRPGSWTRVKVSKLHTNGSVEYHSRMTFKQITEVKRTVLSGDSVPSILLQLLGDAAELQTISCSWLTLLLASNRSRLCFGATRISGVFGKLVRVRVDKPRLHRFKITTHLLALTLS